MVYFKSAGEFIKSKWFLATLFMTIIFLLINYNLLTGNAVAIWDADGTFMPYQVLVADHIRQGKLLLWDCWSNAGVSLTGDAQVGAFSPINLLIGFITGGSTMGFIVLWLTIWWLGGLGVLLLGRHFHVSAWGTLIVALEYLFIGLYITNAEHTSWIVGFSFIPFIIWRLDVAITTNSMLAAVQAGTFWGISALSAYPGFTIATALYCALWVLGRMIIKAKAGKMDRVWLRSGIGVLFCFVVAGTIVLSPTYFSFFYDGAGTTTRVGSLSRDVVLGENAFHLGAITTFASPFLPVQKLYNPLLWEGTDVSMSSIYAGIITFLALFALLNRRSEQWRWWLLFLALFALSLSLSTVFPFRGWLYDLFYPTRFFRHSSLFRAYYLFSITVLALFGIKDLSYIILKQELFYQWKYLKTSGYVIAVSTLLVFIAVTTSLPNVGKNGNLAYFQLFSVWGGICLMVCVLAKKFKNNQNLIVPVCMIIIVLIDIFCTYRISSAVMLSQDPDMIKRWERLDQQHSTHIELTSNGLFRAEGSCYEEAPPCMYYNNDQMINKTPVFVSYTTQINSYHAEMMDYPSLKNMALGSDRIWFSPEALEIVPDRNHFSAFTKKADQSGGIPLVIHSALEMLGKNETISGIADRRKNSELTANMISSAPSLKKIETHLIKYWPTELVFTVRAPTAGWLLVTDRWSRTWKAEVNGLPVNVFGGNFIFKAIKVNEGNNQVRFHYRPAAYPYLLIISWGTIVMVTVLTILGRRITPAKCSA